MSSPHSTNLLNETVPAAAPVAPQHVRSVTHVVPQPMPVYAAPQPVAYAPVAQQGSGVSTTIVMAVVVVLVGAVALLGAWYATRQASPTNREALLMQGAAMRQGFSAGRERGVAAGREQALSGAETTTALRAATAREQAYSQAYARGARAGRNSYHRPTYRGGYGYRGPRYSYGNGSLYSAFGTAQALANSTGAAVDVEIY